MDTDPALPGAITFYSAACYPIFDQIGEDKAREAADFCSQKSQEYPLWMRDKKGKFPEYDVPHFDKRSSVFCIAIMSAYLIWRQRKAGITEYPSSTFLDAANMGYMLCYGRKKENNHDCS